MKKIYAIFTVLCLLLCLTGCNRSDYKNDIPCSKILDSVEEQLPIDLGYKNFDGDHIKYYFRNTKADDDHALRYSVKSENIDEFGIFHAPDDKSKKELTKIAEEYLDELLKEKKAFIASYAPDELPKLENAEVKSFGNYVAYAILDQKGRELFFDTVEKSLKQ